MIHKKDVHTEHQEDEDTGRGRLGADVPQPPQKPDVEGGDQRNESSQKNDRERERQHRTRQPAGRDPQKSGVQYRYRDRVGAEVQDDQERGQQRIFGHPVQAQKHAQNTLVSDVKGADAQYEDQRPRRYVRKQTQDQAPADEDQRSERHRIENRTDEHRGRRLPVSPHEVGIRLPKTFAEYHGQKQDDSGENGVLSPAVDPYRPRDQNVVSETRQKDHKRGERVYGEAPQKGHPEDLSESPPAYLRANGSSPRTIVSFLYSSPASAFRAAK